MAVAKKAAAAKIEKRILILILGIGLVGGKAGVRELLKSGDVIDC